MQIKNVCKTNKFYYFNLNLYPLFMRALPGTGANINASELLEEWGKKLMPL